jgi:hypothetical protein
MTTYFWFKNLREISCPNIFHNYVSLMEFIDVLAINLMKNLDKNTNHPLSKIMRNNWRKL